MDSSEHGASPFALDRCKSLIFAAILGVIAIVVGIHWQLLDTLENGRLLTIGGLAEITIWVLLVSVLMAVHSRRLPPEIYGWLTAGLAVWLVSQTADLMDEFLAQPLWLSTYGEDIARVTGMVLVTVGVLGLIRYSASTMQRLEYLSFHDVLTGLPNRRKFQQHVRERAEGPYSLLIIDLDHFKNINDRHGHDAGDEMLSVQAEMLRDYLGDRGTVFRHGGEEFVVTLDAYGDTELESLGNDLRSRIRACRGPGGSEVTASVGAGTRWPGETQDAFMRRVDRALYEAKHAGRDRLVMAR